MLRGNVWQQAESLSDCEIEPVLYYICMCTNLICHIKERT
jgi:hypothetical protein